MDIYLISDTEKVPNFPEETQLLFLEKFSFDEFKQINGFLDKITYFEDFRLYCSDIEDVYKKLLSSNVYRNSKNKVSSVVKLESVCKTAISEKLGIVGFAD